MNIVIDKITKVVLRWGYCDFFNDGSFNFETEDIIVSDILPFISSTDEYNYKYNPETQLFDNEGKKNQIPKYKVITKDGSKIIKEEVFASKITDGQYTDKLEEVEYNWSGSRLLSKTTKKLGIESVEVYKTEVKGSTIKIITEEL